jgi:membrane protease YdiL (CAAX protease family)
VEIVRNAEAQACLVGITVAVAGITRFGERRRLRAMLGRRPSAFTPLWAVLLVATFILVVAPAMQWTTEAFRVPGFDATLQRLTVLPVWYRVLIVLVGAPIEDILYRGYAQERLAALTRSEFAGAVASSVVFALAHGPLWGTAPATLLLLPVSIGAAFFAWQRDLLALVLAHVATDLLGIAGAR